MSFQNWTRLSTTIGESLSLGKPQWSEIIYERALLSIMHLSFHGKFLITISGQVIKGQ